MDPRTLQSRNSLSLLKPVTLVTASHIPVVSPDCELTVIPDWPLIVNAVFSKLKRDVICHALWMSLVWVSLSPLMKTIGGPMRSLVIKSKWISCPVKGEQHIASVRIVIVTRITRGEVNRAGGDTITGSVTSIQIRLLSEVRST